MDIRSRDYRGSTPSMNGRSLSLGATWYRLSSQAAACDNNICEPWLEDENMTSLKQLTENIMSFSWTSCFYHNTDVY